jgi:hypothetical protein
MIRSAFFAVASLAVLSATPAVAQTNPDGSTYTGAQPYGDPEPPPGWNAATGSMDTSSTAPQRSNTNDYDAEAHEAAARAEADSERTRQDYEEEDADARAAAADHRYDSESTESRSYDESSVFGDPAADSGPDSSP